MIPLKMHHRLLPKSKKVFQIRVVLIQPPHPLYQATYYPVQVEALEQYAEDNGIPYLNHWEAWPDQDSEEIKDYLSEDASEPSAKGHQVWAEYLIDYFIAK